MSVPWSTSAELGVYLGLDSIDTARADLLLRLAHERMSQIVSPVPESARGIELSIAGRAYGNISSARQMGIGSAQVSYGAPTSSVGVGGLYISKSERADLRRAAGRTGAFSIDVLPES